MSTILLVGADLNLLRTRAALLARTGCRTLCATANTALMLQTEHQCEIAVLCHTLPDSVGLALTRIFRERWPQTRILQVLPQGISGTRSAATLADAVCYAEPERLIDRTNELLRRWKLFFVSESQPKGMNYLH